MQLDCQLLLQNNGVSKHQSGARQVYPGLNLSNHRHSGEEIQPWPWLLIEDDAGTVTLRSDGSFKLFHSLTNRISSCDYIRLPGVSISTVVLKYDMVDGDVFRL